MHLAERYGSRAGRTDPGAPFRIGPHGSRGPAGRGYYRERLRMLRWPRGGISRVLAERRSVPPLMGYPEPNVPGEARSSPPPLLDLISLAAFPFGVLHVKTRPRAPTGAPVLWVAAVGTAACVPLGSRRRTGVLCRVYVRACASVLALCDRVLLREGRARALQLVLGSRDERRDWPGQARMRA